jgi:hypothetical protein
MKVFEAIRRWLYQPLRLRPDIRCAACDRSSTVQGPKFIHGPGVYLCQPCSSEALERVASVTPGTSSAHRPGDTAPSRCSFCGRKTPEARGIVGLVHAAICRDCVELCAKVFATAPTR